MVKTTIADSPPKPARLAEPEKLRAPRRLAWMKCQEDAGVDIVAGAKLFSGAA